MLTAFYDLAVSPPKYDFLGFLLNAERHRQLIQAPKIRFVFVPGPDEGFRDDELPPRGGDKREIMLRNIVIPMCFMLGYEPEIVRCRTRDEARQYQEGEIFPPEYLLFSPTRHYGMHIITRAFERRFYPLQAPGLIDKQPDLITITLRESHYWQCRNSNREVWLKAAKRIEQAGLRVLFIPDVDSGPIEGFDTEPGAATNLWYRAALYEAAAHNFFVSNGPAWMAACMDVPGTVFKLIAPEAVLCNEKYYTKIGFPPGSQIGRDNHRIIWEDDTEEAVIHRVNEVIECVR